MRAIARLIAAIWLGSAVFLMLAATAAFRATANPGAAADIVGAMLTRWHYIALGAPLLLFAIELRRVRRFILATLFIALILAAAQSLLDLRIRTIRRQAAPVPITQLSPVSPLRQQFNVLHTASTTLLLVETLAAIIVVAARGKHAERGGAASQEATESPE